MKKQHNLSMYFINKELNPSLKLRKLKINEKICTNCYNQMKKSLCGVNVSTYKNYFEIFGFPNKWIHTTHYLTCDSCRQNNQERVKRHKMNTLVQEKYLLDLENIINEITNETFGKTDRKETKLDKIWKKNANLYVNRLKIDKKISLNEKMKLYKDYRENNDSKFYSTTKWKSLRELIFKAFGKKCMKCHIIPENDKDLHCDHIFPRSLFPKEELNPFNLQVLCSSCNCSKSNVKIVDYRDINYKNIILSSFTTLILEKYNDLLEK